MKFLLTALLAVSLLACAERGSDEQQIHDVIAKMEKAAESRDTGDVLEHVADGYADAQGFDKTRLRNFLRGYFLSNPKVELLVDIESLELPVPGLAKARIDVTVLPAADRGSFALELRRHEGVWQVVRVDLARER